MLYGADESLRVMEPADSSFTSQNTFGWLASASFDDKSNAMVYEYKSENSDRVDMSLVNERNRTVTGRSLDRYVKKIKYRNVESQRQAHMGHVE